MTIGVIRVYHEAKGDTMNAEQIKKDLEGHAAWLASNGEAGKRLGWSGKYLLGANLHVADLTGADLREALIRDASLAGANFTDADLLGANLNRTDLSTARFCNTRMADGEINNAHCGDL